MLLCIHIYSFNQPTSVRSTVSQSQARKDGENVVSFLVEPRDGGDGVGMCEWMDIVNMAVWQVLC